jgi:hypothetical protein
LRLLTPAPHEWVTKAQSTILEMLGRDRPADADGLTETALTRLRHALEHDTAFRKSFDTDPVAAAEAAGWFELARGLEREMRALIALAERIAADDSFRSELSADPVQTLENAGVPSASAEPLLQALGETHLAGRQPDVVAHQFEPLPMTTRLAMLLLGNGAFVERLRTVARRRVADPRKR